MKHKKTEISEETVEVVENVEEVVNEVEPEVVEETKEVEPEVIEETVEEVVNEIEPEVPENNKLENFKCDLVDGAVRNCKKLNLREEPNKSSNVACVLLEDESVLIDLENSTDDFYKISARGIDGYCMKQFIEII